MSSLRPRFFIRLVIRCLGALALVGILAVRNASAQTTTFSGTVYSPKGLTGGGDPIPNIFVFVEDPSSPAPVFGQGITYPGQNCAVQPDLVPNTVKGYATTKFDGTFSFNVTGVLPDPVRLFIQAGKWRSVQSIPLANINVGGSNTYTLGMPASAVAGVSDLPNVAVVTGSADDVECIFPQIGISPSEVTDIGNGGHINFFTGNGGAGEAISSSTPTETQLVSSAIPLTNYDLVIFGCQGPTGHTEANTTNQTYLENLVAYANSGGRVFATHWEFPWVTNPTEWSGLSSFGTSTSTMSATTTGQLSTSYSGEPILAAWMNYIGALDVSPPNLEFTLTAVFYENLLAVNPPAQVWVTLPDYSNSPNQFSFDTPVGSAGTPTAALDFSNSTSTFLTGDPNDVITVNVSNTSTSPTVPGLILTLTIPAVLQVSSIADSSGGAWTCTFTSPTATCTLPSVLAPGAADSVAISFSIPLGTTLGTYEITGLLSKGGLGQSLQCGRVLYNDYHVEKSPPKGALWNGGANCSTAKLDDAQKFLEYSLYNLSSFVAPANSDSFQIQQSSTITWNPPSPAYYGTTIAQIEDAVSNTPGTLAYSFNPSGVDPLGAAPYTFNTTFTPTDTVDYLTSTATRAVTILPDPTTTTLTTTSTGSVTLGTSISFTATLTDTYAPPVGTLTVYDSPTAVSGISSPAPGMTLIYTASVPASSVSFSLSTLLVGTHNILACFAAPLNTLGSPNMAPSCSASIPQVITPIPVVPSPTETLLTSSINPSVVGQAVVFKSTVETTGTFSSIPQGVVSFLDGTSTLGTATLDSTGTATFTTATLTAGTHPITASYAAQGTFAASVSLVLAQVVDVPIASAGYGFILQVLPSTFSVTAGSTATIAVTVVELNGFKQPVQLTCPGMPAEASCTFAQSLLPDTGGVTQLTVTPAAPHNCGSTAPYFAGTPGGLLALSVTALAAFLLGKRRRTLQCFALFLAILLFPMLQGCGTGNCTDLGVKPGTYTFTVTATSTGASPLTHTQPMTMTVTIP